MTWLMTQMWVELLIAAVFGGAVGWALHLLYAKRSAGPAESGPADGANMDYESRARIAELESQLKIEKSQADEVRHRAGIQKPGEEGPLAEGSLMWRNRHLESRVRFLEGKLADLESEAGAVAPIEDQNDDATRLRWRNSYLEGRVKYLEEELVRTGGLTPANGLPTAGDATTMMRARQLEGEQPELLDTPRDGRADDLKLISGIGPKLEQKLNSIGIWHYAQISSWNQAEVDWVNGAISFHGRIERERWVSQAATLLQNASEPETEDNPG
jgi:predicted flap endonuclease-1-like 5' DNA nuclease